MDEALLLDVGMLDEIAEHVASLQQVSGVHSGIWQQLAYSYVEASSGQWYKESTILRFGTVASNDAYHVTGRMVVGGDNYLKLVETFKNDHKWTWTCQVQEDVRGSDVGTYAAAEQPLTSNRRIP